MSLFGFFVVEQMAARRRQALRAELNEQEESEAVESQLIGVMYHKHPRESWREIRLVHSEEVAREQRRLRKGYERMRRFKLWLFSML